MNVRRTLGTAALVGALSFGFGTLGAPSVFGDPATIPAQQADGCTHGNSGRPCRDDPQPDKGKDCKKHGAEAADGSGQVGGVNEDHCGDDGSGTGGN